MAAIDKLKSKKFLLSLFILFLIGGATAYYFSQEDSCNVAHIPLKGEIVSYLPPEYFNESGDLAVDAVSAEEVRDSLLEADADEEIDVILFEVDSPGGTLVGGEQVAEVVERIKKPVVALVTSSALSGAYYSISPSDIIFASQYSDIGGVAITMSYLDNVEKNRKEGLAFVEINSGRFKDMGNPNKELSLAEKQMLERQLRDLHKVMVQDIAKKRKLEVEKLAKIADGSGLTGQEALSLGLIDKIGSFFDAKKWIEEKVGKAEVCWDYGKGN